MIESTIRSVELKPLHSEATNYKANRLTEKSKIDNFVDNDRKTVVVQGLGYVGTAMLAALSQAKNKNNECTYNVIGIDLGDEDNYWKITQTNQGKSPIVSSDKNINEAFERGLINGNLFATCSNYAYEKADVVVIDVNLDITKKKLGDAYNYEFSYTNFNRAIETIAKNVLEETLIVVESTVPPGTTEQVIFPIFQKYFAMRGLNINKLYLAHCFERVMPGNEYLNSITNLCRVYSAINAESKKKAKNFLQTFINTENYPLYELHSTTASEMAKVLENSFRATNIAFIQEWTEFAEQADVDLFEIINAIRVRPTHKNIAQPGFGVGGYCLPKDSLLADWSYNNLFGAKRHLRMSLNAIRTNDLMPKHVFEIVKSYFNNLENLNITILGISYLSDVADTRYSPADYFYDLCKKEGANLILHDSMVEYWQEKRIAINSDINSLKDFSHDVVIFAVTHTQYLELTSEEIISLLPNVKLIIDANNLINDEKANDLIARGIKVVGVGKGHWNKKDKR